MNNTFQTIIFWDKGSAISERMSAKLVSIEDYKDIDPQCPNGGPDGGKDIVGYKNGTKYIIGCYFPSGEKSFDDIKDKFDNDLQGVRKNNGKGFAFVTNQKITPSQRLELANNSDIDIDIFHGERVCNLLDSPKGYGIRLEYLGIELSKEEQLSFLNNHLELKEDLDEIKKTLSELQKVTSHIAGQILPRDAGHNPTLSFLPVSGVSFTSRLSLEDLLSIHKTVILETDIPHNPNFFGFRKVEVWIGQAGGGMENADYVPIPPNLVIKETIKLLNWWRNVFEEIVHGIESEKVLRIAEFHFKLVKIHPFMDGNGRVARTITSIQYKELLNKEINFEQISKEDYYKALEEIETENPQKLCNLFKSFLS